MTLGAHFHRYALSLTVLFLSRFDPSQGFVISRQVFVHRRHCGPGPLIGHSSPRLSRVLMLRSPTWKSLTMAWCGIRHSRGLCRGFALACAIAQAPTDQGFPSTSGKRSFFTVPIMSSQMSSAVLMFRNSASHASRPIISRLSGNSVVRSMPLY